MGDNNFGDSLLRLSRVKYGIYFYYIMWMILKKKQNKTKRKRNCINDIENI